MALALLLPAAAGAAGSGGVPSPDPSTQIAPDPAPSGGEFGSHGGGGKAPPQPASTPDAPSTGQSNPAPAGSTGSTATAPTSTGRVVPATHRKARRHHAAAKHRRAHPASRPRVKVEAAQRRPATFATTLDVALPLPVLAPTAAAAGHSIDDIFLLASIVLVLFVLGGLLVVRSSAELMRRERPA